jgi:hypothetical protein
MAIHEITDPEGQVWEIDDNGQDPKAAFAAFTSSWKPSKQPQQAAGPRHDGTRQRGRSCRHGSRLLHLQGGYARRGQGSDIAAAAGGDVANLAMLGLAGPARLAQQTALGGAMGAAGGDASSPWRKAMGQGGRSIAEAILPINQGAPSRSVGNEYAARASWHDWRDCWESCAPQAGLMFLTGKLAKGAAKGPAPLPEAALALAAEGGQPTAAMRATSPLGRGVLGAVEQSARTNPLLTGKFESIDQANALAAGNIAKKAFGADIMEPGLGARAGQELQTSLGNLAEQRAEGYKGALGEMAGKLEAVKSPVEGIKAAKKMGPTMAAAVEVAQAEALPSVARMFDAVKAKLASGKLTPKQIELELQDLRHQFDAQYAQLNQANPGAFSAADRSFGIINKAMKNAYYDGLNKVSKGMGDVLREAKGDYAEASEGMAPLTKALGFKGGMAPEAAATKLMESGTESLKALKDTMMPEDWANTRQQIAKAIIGRAMGKEGGISGPKLKTFLNADPKIREIIPIVFETGTELADMNKLVKIMETAKQNELGVANPSGSWARGATQAQTVAPLAAMVNPALLGPLAGKMAMDAAYTYGAVPAQNVLRAGQAAAAPMAGAIASNKRPQVVGRVGLSTARGGQDDRLRPKFIQALNR